MIAVIFGCGYTGRRVARRLLLRGVEVHAITRLPERLAGLEVLGLRVHEWDSAGLPAGAVLLHSLSALAPHEREASHGLIRKLKPFRTVYISTTSVYGTQEVVEASTPAAPCDEKGEDRVAEEQWVAGLADSSFIVRPAGIYGPGRGIHLAVKEGRPPRSGGGVVSRIHVDDLAAIVEAGMRQDICGIYPVADELPCPSGEVADYCCRILRLRRGPTASETSIRGRSVDGREVVDRLGLRLTYPTYESGILAALAEANF